MHENVTARWGAAFIAVALCAAVLAEPPIPRRDGTLKDLERLPAKADLLGEAFGRLPIVLDASALTPSAHVGERSRSIRLKPGVRYTLAVTYRASGKSIVTAGVQWGDPDRPTGLAEADDLRAAFPASDDWALRVLTFQSDPKLPEARILLKAWGGMKVEVKNIKLVEGWYVD